MNVPEGTWACKLPRVKPETSPSSICKAVLQSARSNDALGAELRRLAEIAPCDILVNLSGVQQVDSSGISTLVRSFVTLERNAGSLKLLNPTGHVREVLELTRLIQSIPTYTDEAKAVASFRGGVATA